MNASNANAQQTETQVVSENDLRNINAAGGVVGQYVIYGPGAPSYDPRTDGEVN